MKILGLYDYLEKKTFDCWIKKDAILPENFNSMEDSYKISYIQNNRLLHRIKGPSIIWSNGCFGIVDINIGG